MKQNNGFIGIGLILAIVLGVAVIGGGAYYLGNNNSEKELNNPVVNLEKNLPDIATLPSTYGGSDIKLLSFKAVGSNFVVETDYFNEKASIKVFADPTGTGIGELDPMTTGAFLGTMTPDLNGETVKWTLSGDTFKDRMTNNLYATLYLNEEGSKSIKFPSEGVFVYESIFGESSKTVSSKYTLIAKSDNPYSFVSPPGASGYYLVKKNINSDNVMYFYGTHLKDNGVYIYENKIYYNPTEYSQIVRFGSKVSGNTDVFRASVNQEINKNGYAIVKVFSDGGPDYINYTLTVSATDNNLLKLASCGVSLSKISEWSVISNANNEIKLDIPGDTHTGFSGIDIKCVLSNTITDTDAKFGNITYFYDMGKKAWMETDNQEGEGITPNTIPVLAKPLFTTADGFPVFRGTGRWLTYIVPISPSSILYLKEGDTEGGYTQTLTNLVKTIKKL